MILVVQLSSNTAKQPRQKILQGEIVICFDPPNSNPRVISCRQSGSNAAVIFEQINFCTGSQINPAISKTVPEPRDRDEFTVGCDPGPEGRSCGIQSDTWKVKIERFVPSAARRPQRTADY